MGLWSQPNDRALRKIVVNLPQPFAKAQSGLGPARWLLLTALLTMTSPVWAAAGDPIRVELNAAESVQSRCRLSFVIENKSEAAIESLKLDLAVFGRDGVIQRRLVTELGPVRGAKTIVKAFELDTECGQVGSILVNDVTACAPMAPDACLDRLALSSHVPNVRLFK
jgi:hypothetical protein